MTEMSQKLSYTQKSSRRNKNSGDRDPSTSALTSIGEAKKCHVYIHHFGKNDSYSTRREGSQLHQNMYMHEVNNSDFKLKNLKTQFDNLSLTNPKYVNIANSRKSNAGTSYNVKYNQNLSQARCPHGSCNQLTKMHKMFLYKPERKAAIDKLEETYWSKWKPQKNNVGTKPRASVNLVTKPQENVVFMPVEQKPEVLVQPQLQESGDSRETEMATLSEDPDESPVFIQFTPSVSESFKTEEKIDLQQEKIINVHNMDELNNEPSVEECVESEEIVSQDLKNDDSESISVPNLKHTDSMIIISKKQHSEKTPRYQQPKCIKLFKKVGYSSSTPIRFINGGSYPLKSCLKRDNFSTRSSSPLGRPGSPIGLLNVRANKTGSKR